MKKNLKILLILVVVIILIALLIVAIQFSINQKSEGENTSLNASAEEVSNNNTSSNTNLESDDIDTEEEQLENINLLNTNDYEMYVYESVVTDYGPDYGNPKKIESISDMNKIADVLNTAVQYTPEEEFDYMPKYRLEIVANDIKYEAYIIGNTFNTENDKNLILIESPDSKYVYQIDEDIDLSEFYNE